MPISLSSRTRSDVGAGGAIVYPACLAPVGSPCCGPVGESCLDTLITKLFGASALVHGGWPWPGQLLDHRAAKPGWGPRVASAIRGKPGVRSTQVLTIICLLAGAGGRFGAKSTSLGQRCLAGPAPELTLNRSSGCLLGPMRKLFAFQRAGRSCNDADLPSGGEAASSTPARAAGWIRTPVWRWFRACQIAIILKYMDFCVVSVYRGLKSNQVGDCRDACFGDFRLFLVVQRA
jgi:hypothetical protein